MRLHEQRDQFASKLAEASEWVQDLRVYLHSSKFQGEGNDYINVNELLRHLDNLRDILADASN